MALYKKDFKAIASIIANVKEFHEDLNKSGMMQQPKEREADMIANDLATWIQQTKKNPRFDRERFLNACELGDI